MENKQSTEEKLFFHTKKKSIHKNVFHKRNVTFAGIVHEDKVLIGLAECSEKDQFVKAKGRLIATGRANAKPCHILEIKPNTSISKQFVEACRRIVNHV